MHCVHTAMTTINKSQDVTTELTDAADMEIVTKLVGGEKLMTELFTFQQLLTTEFHMSLHSY